MQLFYHPTVSEGDSEVVFPKEESRHIVKVLRKKEGDVLHLTNGKGWIFTTEVISAQSKNCVAKITASEKQQPLPYALHLAVAPTKMNDRYEWFLEKATEIGISEITPLICERSERKVFKKDRFDRVLQSALKQSLHTYFPVLNEPIAFSDFLKEKHLQEKFIAHCDEGSERKLLSRELMPKQNVLVLIGPEGDFSPEEILAANDAGFQAVSLGNSRLRTETAAIVACHTAALINEIAGV